MEQNNRPRGIRGFAGKFINTGNILTDCGLPVEKINTRGNSVLAIFGNVYASDADGSGINTLDAGTILGKYLEKGDSYLNDLDGDYTLIIASGESVRILRDFKGAGPQLFHTQEFFADSLTTLLNTDSKNFTVDLDDLGFFLRYGYVPPLKSGFFGISRLPAGHMLEYKNGMCKVTPVHRGKTEGSSQAKTESEYVSGFMRRHADSIKRRISGKENISLLLSGGYDSGGNLAALRSFYSGKLTAYTISFKDNPFSELEFVKTISEQYKADLRVYEINGSELAGLPDLILQTGVPFQESGMMINYCAMKMVSKDHPDIVLGGDGNDQIFGTGAREIGLRWVADKTGGIWLLRLLKMLTGKLNSPEIIQKIKLYNDKILDIYQPERWGFAPGDLKTAPPEKNEFSGSGTGPLVKMFEYKRKNVDSKYTINEVILFKASRMAALFGNPISFPYLTTDLQKFIDDLPLEYKTRGTVMEWIRGKGKSKYLHKLSYRNSLPPSITARKKQGGFVPLSIFFNNPAMNDRIFEIIEKSTLIDKLLKDKTKAMSKLRTSLQNRNSWFWAQQSNYFRIFNLLVLAIWERLMIDKESPDEIRNLLHDPKIG
jgi:asparagine synthase (glutamine-hydrolysing)